MANDQLIKDKQMSLNFARVVAIVPGPGRRHFAVMGKSQQIKENGKDRKKERKKDRKKGENKIEITEIRKKIEGNNEGLFVGNLAVGVVEGERGQSGGELVFDL